jgi:hypothetical protein
MIISTVCLEIPNTFFPSREKDLLFLPVRLPSKTLWRQPCSIPWKQDTFSDIFDIK